MAHPVKVKRDSEVQFVNSYCPNVRRVPILLGMIIFLPPHLTTTQIVAPPKQSGACALFQSLIILDWKRA